MRKKAIVRTLRDIFILILFMVSFVLGLGFIGFVVYKYFYLISYLINQPIDSIDTVLVAMVVMFGICILVCFVSWRYCENLYDVEIEDYILKGDLK